MPLTHTFRHLALVTLALMLSAPGVAAETLVVDAEAHYETGLTHMAAGRHLEAAAAFERAYAVEPNATFLWNMGRAYEEAGTLETAKERFLQFLTLEELPPKRRAMAVERIRGIETQLADAAHAAERPPDPTPTPTPVPAPEPPPTPPTVVAEEPEPAGPPGWAWGVLGGGGAVLAVGTGLLIHAEIIRDELAHPQLDKSGAVMGPTQAQDHRLEEEGNASRVAGAVMTGLGAAAVIGGVELLLIGDEDEAPSVSVRPQPHGAVLTWQGRF